MKSISTKFNTSRVVEAMLRRQTRRHVRTTKKHRGLGRRRLRSLPMNRLRQTGAQIEPSLAGNGRPARRKPR
jgi:hypothetical protein